MTIATELLEPLLDRIPILARPCRVNRAEARIESAVTDWAVTTGLAAGRRAGELRAARYGWMAAHAFSEASVADAALFGRWYAWAFVIDDLLDDGPAGADPHTADRVYRTLSDPGRPAARHSAVERALSELWQETTARTGADWRARFLAHLRQHRAVCRREAYHRATGTFPAVRRYPALRRQSNLPYLFDLAEVVLRCRVPAAIYRTGTWQTLVRGSSDVTAWCNDLVSVAKDAAAGDPINYVLTVEHAHGEGREQAAAWVRDRIGRRCAQLQEAALALPALCDRHGLDRGAEGDLSRVACALLAFPRVHLDWTLVSGRYAAREGV